MQVYGPIQDIRQRERDHECRQSCNGSKEEAAAAAAKHLLQKQAWQELYRDHTDADKLIAKVGGGLFPKTS